MPRNTREWAKRKLKESQGNLDWALFHLHEIEEKYRPVHPDIADAIEKIMQVIVLADQSVEKLGESF